MRQNIVTLTHCHCSQEDIQDFLARTRILGGSRGIFITTDDRGRPSGDAYVEVETCDDLEQALKMHNFLVMFKKHIDQMEQDFEHAVMSS